MKFFRLFIIGISFCFFLVSCKGTNEPTEKIPKKTDEKLYDIYYLKEAPKASGNHELSKVIKIVVVKHEDSQEQTIAIDVGNSSIFFDPSNSSLGIRASNGKKEITDVNEAVHLLEKYNVQDWKEDYTIEDPKSYTDGVSWNVWIQYTDGSVQRFGGSGSGLEKITPEGFENFFHELNAFVEERLEKDSEIN